MEKPFVASEAIEVERKNESVLVAVIANLLFCVDGEYGAEVYRTRGASLGGVPPARLMLMKSALVSKAAGIEIMAKNISIPEDGSRLSP